MGQPVARAGDAHTCPKHGGGPVLPPGCRTVLIGGQPAAREGDLAQCPKSPDRIARGEPTVQIGGRPAARQGDPTAHGGRVTGGFPTVQIGLPAVD